MWHITLAAIKALTLPYSFTTSSATLLLKKLTKVLIPCLVATSATLEEGSIPKCFTPFLAKFLSIIPSLLPISTTKGSLSKYWKTESENSLKCLSINVEVPEKKA